jgi:hypothetical protein
VVPFRFRALYALRSVRNVDKRVTDAQHIECFQVMPVKAIQLGTVHPALKKNGSFL